MTSRTFHPTPVAYTVSGKTRRFVRGRLTAASFDIEMEVDERGVASIEVRENGIVRASGRMDRKAMMFLYDALHKEYITKRLRP